jgi:hypothetical protein
MSATVILYDERQTTLPGVTASGDSLWLDTDQMAAATGWKLETAGLCRGDACVALDPAWQNDSGHIDLTAFAAHMDQPITRDEQVWAFGASVSTLHDARFSLEAPEFSLPDIDGVMHSLSDYRGQKVFLYSWGSY